MEDDRKARLSGTLLALQALVTEMLKGHEPDDRSEIADKALKALGTMQPSRMVEQSDEAFIESARQHAAEAVREMAKPSKG